MSKQAYSPPVVAILIMKLILPARVLNALLGDLIEEFQLRVQQDAASAQLWFWQQSLATSFIYFNKIFNSPVFVKKLIVIVPLLLFVIVFLLLTWLSYAYSVTGYSSGFWQNLLAGYAHLAILEPAFWLDISSQIEAIDGVGFLFYPPAVLTTLCNFAILYLLNKRPNFTSLKMACWGYSLMLLPYVWSIFYIGSHTLADKQIGPYITFGLLSFFYMILPVSYLVHRKLKQDQS
jgi:hypothetical protein